jgi:hypothetical protein
MNIKNLSFTMLAISLLVLFANVKAVEPLPPTLMSREDIEQLFEDLNGLIGGRFNQQYQDAEADRKKKRREAHEKYVLNPIRNPNLSSETKREIEKGYSPAIDQILKEHADRVAAIQSGYDENDRKKQNDAIKTFCNKVCWVSTDQFGQPMMGWKIWSSTDGQYSYTVLDKVDETARIYGVNFWERCKENNLKN